MRAQKLKRQARSRPEPEPRRKDGYLTTGDMARLSRNTLRTVRFYEEEGLLKPVQRTEGGHRLFPMRELKKLLLVTDLRAAGFALEEIREILLAKAQASSGARASREVIAKIDAQVALMNTRISLLRRLSGELAVTRQHLAACTKCEDSKLFPNYCGECGKIKKTEVLPDALGVLWSVDA